MSGQPVDAVGRISHAADVMEANGMGAVTVADLRASVDAVDELIEADKEYDAAIAEGKELNRKVAESGWFELALDALRKSGLRIIKAQERRRQALENIDGAA